MYLILIFCSVMVQVQQSEIIHFIQRVHLHVWDKQWFFTIEDHLIGFITLMECVYCAVRTEYLNIIYADRRAVVWVVSCWPLFAENRVWFHSGLRDMSGWQSGAGTGFSSSTSGFSCRYHCFIPSSSACCLYRRKNGRSLGNLRKEMPSRIPGNVA